MVWGLCESHTIGLGQGHMFGETTDRQEKGKNTCALHLCLEINALWYSLYTGMLPVFFTPVRFTLPGAPGDSSGVYLVIINSPAGALLEGRQVQLVNLLQGT